MPHSVYYILAVVVAFILLSRLRARIGGDAAQKIQDALKAGAKLVDVRTAGEYRGGHLDGAVNIPLSDLPGRTRDLGSRNKPVVVYCASGVRSSQAVRFLAQQGYEQVLDLKTLSNGQRVGRSVSR